MSKVLLCWELGAGIGYTEWLVWIARALKARGCTPVLALREVDRSMPLVDGLDVPVLPVPVAVGRIGARSGGKGFHPRAFSDLMGANGFGSAAELGALVRGWAGILDVVRPDLVVGAYSPVLGVACYRRVPLALIGYAYTTPPADGPLFPDFRSGGQSYFAQDQMLETVQAVQRARGAPVPERLTDIYRGEERFVLTFPELDPYREQRRERPVGPLEDLGSLDPLPAAPRFYAYLVGDKPFVPKVVEGLLGCGLPGAIYMRDRRMKPPEDLAARNIRWLDRPPPLSKAVRWASVVVHHGGANTVHWALGAGRPQVMVPRILDQELSAAAAQRLGVARHVTAKNDPLAVADAVRRLTLDQDVLYNTAAYAKLVRARGQHDSLPRVVERCLALLG